MTCCLINWVTTDLYRRWQCSSCTSSLTDQGGSRYLPNTGPHSPTGISAALSHVNRGSNLLPSTAVIASHCLHTRKSHRIDVGQPSYLAKKKCFMKFWEVLFLSDAMSLGLPTFAHVAYQMIFLHTMIRSPILKQEYPRHLPTMFSPADSACSVPGRE